MGALISAAALSALLIPLFAIRAVCEPRVPAPQAGVAVMIHVRDLGHQRRCVAREHLPATFIYAGIDVERCGVFTGTRGRQLAGRCELICTGAFPYRQEWTQLIAALEATLRLHHHEPGTLPAQARYLHQRTGGMIGSLTHLICGAAIRAILSGQEEITRPLLDTVRIDHAAESATRRQDQERAGVVGRLVPWCPRLR
jgi:hypothetical protein